MTYQTIDNKTMICGVTIEPIEPIEPIDVTPYILWAVIGIGIMYILSQKK